MSNSKQTAKNTLVSIIMNCLNGEKYLREAIDSIYAQTYKNWEIIFWDNASTDKSGEIAKSYDDKLRYFKGEKSIPLGEARNMAMGHCRGDYIGFLDVDDVWLPVKLKLQIKKINEEPNAIICYSDGYDMLGERKTTKKFSSHRNVKIYQGKIFDHLIYSNFINWQTVLVRKKHAGDNLYFNEDLTYAEDHEFLLRLSLIGDIIYCPQPLIYYRYHGNNMSRDYELNLKESEIIQSLFEKEIINRKININKIKALNYGTLVIRLIKQGGDYRKFLGYLLKYPNIQNIVVYFLIKMKMAHLLIRVKS